MRTGFSKRVLEGLQTDKSKEFFYDTKVPHLCLLVTQAGAKTFYLYRRVNGRPKQIKIGRFPAVTVEQARKAAERMNGLVAGGGDPSKPDRNGTTFQQLYDEYVEQYSTLKKRASTIAHDRRLWKNHLKKCLGSKTLAEIDVPLLRRMHGKIASGIGTSTSNVCKTLLSSIFTYAIQNGHWQHANPMRQIERYPEVERERYLHANELPTFFRELEASRSTTFKDCIKLALFTGARIGNVCAVRWAHLNLVDAVWVIPASEHKTKKSHTIALCPEALEILQRRKRTSDSEYVFPGPCGASYYAYPKYSWRALVKRCGFAENIKPHDLRRTLASWQAAGGSSLLVIGKSLGHRSATSTQVYARVDLEPIRRSVELASRAISIAANPEESEQ